ncbi:hypothetical protein EYF80_057776 [Liparis tanakae]|uniref:Uncharacterized protein n=1 Tax=Liparis tanakae TaxID=230148 RepID=A0A4Z2ET95_9TELE|nr:hypothetical protein EYF80_057776 [Liparis tanakae]
MCVIPNPIGLVAVDETLKVTSSYGETMSSLGFLSRMSGAVLATTRCRGPPPSRLSWQATLNS